METQEGRCCYQQVTINKKQLPCILQSWSRLNAAKSKTSSKNGVSAGNLWPFYLRKARILSH